MRPLDSWPGRTGRPTPPQDVGVPALAEMVFRTYGPRVYGLARRLLATEAEAEAVTLGVLAEVVRRLGRAPGEDGLTAWLRRVTVGAVRACRGRRTGRWARRVAEPAGRDPVERAIGRLPEVYRDVLVLADVEGLACAEVGELLGMNLRAVQGRLHRARLLMRQDLAAPFGSDGVSG